MSIFIISLLFYDHNEFDEFVSEKFAALTLQLKMLTGLV